MLAVSAKGTVPVLVINKATVIDESIEIMLWALKLNDPQNLLQAEDPNTLNAMLALIWRNDNEFKPNLEVYKLAKRFHKKSELTDRQSCEDFVVELERKLYLQSPYPKLRDWLNRHLKMPLFTKAMAKYPLWLDSHEAFLLGKN